MDFLLSYNNNQEQLWFPVIPNEGIVLKYVHNNEQFSGIQSTLQTIGTPGLRTFDLESFFPNYPYKFIRPNAALYDGWYYVGMIERGLAAKVPFRAQYFDNDMKLIFNLPVTIYSFDYWITQAGNVGYRIAFTEYKWGDLTAGSLSEQTYAGENTAAGSYATAAGLTDVNGNTGVQTNAQAAESSAQGYTKLFTASDATMMAKVFFGEARGIRSQTEIACIGWTILNRLDRGGYGKTIAAVITMPNQFYYKAGAKTTSDYGYDLVALATDVCTRWSKEHSGQTNVGRVLPKNYLWYAGSDGHNWFYPAYPMRKAQRWTYTLPSPYST